MLDCEDATDDRSMFTFVFGKLLDVIVRPQVLEVAVTDYLALDCGLLLNLVEVAGGKGGFSRLRLRNFLLNASVAAVIKLLRHILLSFGDVKALDLLVLSLR